MKSWQRTNTTPLMNLDLLLSINFSISSLEYETQYRSLKVYFEGAIWYKGSSVDPQGDN